MAPAVHSLTLAQNWEGDHWGSEVGYGVGMLLSQWPKETRQCLVCPGLPHCLVLEHTLRKGLTIGLPPGATGPS